MGTVLRISVGNERILISDRAAGYVADVLAAAWRALLEPEWRTLRAILERDVVYRAGQLASKGWAAALTDLHADLGGRDLPGPWGLRAMGAARPDRPGHRPSPAPRVPQGFWFLRAAR